MKDSGQKEIERQGERRREEEEKEEMAAKSCGVRRRRRRKVMCKRREGVKGCEIARAKKGGGDCISEVGGSRNEKRVKVDLV